MASLLPYGYPRFITDKEQKPRSKVEVINIIIKQSQLLKILKNVENLDEILGSIKS